MDDNETVEMSVSQKDLVRRYIGDMMGLKAIGKEIHRDPRSFKHELTNLGIKIPFPGSVWKKMQDHYSGKFNKSISPFLMDIIQGSLLGDGNIRLQSKVAHHIDNPSIDEYIELLSDIEKIRQRVRNGSGLTRDDISRWNQGIEVIRCTNTAQFRIHKSIVEIRWVKNLMELFRREIDIQSKYIKEVYRDQALKWSCGFDTLSSVQFFDIWKSWYTYNGKKVKKLIPSEILTSISPDILLQWYTGDGYYSSSKIALGTYGFRVVDQQFLVDLLYQIGVASKIYIKDVGNEISISHTKDNRDHFFNYLLNARGNSLARSELPQKFDTNYRKKDLIAKLKKTNPEFFDKATKPNWDEY